MKTGTSLDAPPGAGAAVKHDHNNRPKSEPRTGEADAAEAVSRLNAIEQAILVGIASGASSRSLAARLEMPLSAIEKHRTRLMSKLNAASTADAVRIALLAGMDDWPDCTNLH